MNKDDENGKEDDELGYMRPPKQYQFKKGQSGNYSGRPKKVRTLEEEVRRELGRVSDENGLRTNNRRHAARTLVRLARQEGPSPWGRSKKLTK